MNILDDEKQWISKDHPLSFRGFMQRTVYDKSSRDYGNAGRSESISGSESPEYISELIEKLGALISSVSVELELMVM